MPNPGEQEPVERRSSARAWLEFLLLNVLLGGSPIFFLLLRYVWRSVLVGVAADLIASFIDGNNGTINLVTFAGAFAVSLPVFMLLARRRRALERLSLSEKMLGWWDEHVEAGRSSPLLTRRPTAALLFPGILCLGPGGLLVALVLFPGAMGQERWSTAGRLVGAAVGGFLTVGGLALLVLMWGTVARAPFASTDPNIGGFPRRTRRAFTIVMPGLSAVVIAALYVAAPSPTAAQRAADRARAAAAKTAEDRTRNVHALGTHAADGEFVYSVRSIREVAGFPHRTARAGDTFVVADISVTNRSDRAAPPFPFRGEGSLLIDSEGKRHAAAQGSDYAPQFVPPHATHSLALVFELPTDRPVNGLVLWDVFDTADRNGATYVYFRAGSAPAVRSLGPTASGH